MKLKIKEWLQDRFGTGPVWRQVLNRRVAKAPWYFGDGPTLTLLLLVLVVTGALMGMTYSPAVDSAHASVAYLTHRQVFGWFIRGLHYWSAGLMVVMLFFHLFRQILLAGYKAPREGTWLIGVLLFFLVIFMSFSGYLLRWDERSIAAIKVALHMFNNVPFVGEWLVVLIQGAQEIGPLTLTRIYGLHVIIVPLLLLSLVGYHIYLVIQNGTISPTEQEVDVDSAETQREIYKQDAESKDRGESFYPNEMGSGALMSSAFFILAVILTLTLGPPEILPEATQYAQAQPMEEWWFWWYSGLIALLPRVVAPGFVVVFPVVVFLGLVLLPFLDRGPRRGLRRPWAAGFVVGSVIAILVLSALRRESAWTAWPSDAVPPVPPGVQLSEGSEIGRQLFPRYGCNSCHAVGGHGRQVAVDFAQLDKQLSRAEMERFIRQPPEGIAMPAYQDISAADLDRVIDFLMAAQTFPREF